MNNDEKTLFDDTAHKKNLTYPEIMDPSKVATSTMSSIYCHGIILPSYIVYKAVIMYDT